MKKETKKEAIVFWSDYSWTWVDKTSHDSRCMLSDLSLDDAIRDAHKQSYIIVSVNKTRGQIPMPSPTASAVKEEEKSE